MRRVSPAATALLLAAVVLSGCSEDEGTSTALSGSEQALTDTDFGAPATGATITGTGYSFRIPPSWKDATAAVTQADVDTAAHESPATGGFADNVYVATKRYPGASLELLDTSVLAELIQDKALETLPGVVIDGVEAIHHRGPGELGPSKFFLEQFAAVDDGGKLTIITFNYKRSVPEAERAAEINSIMSSWRWAS